MNDVPQTSDVYDKMYIEGGYQGVYDLPYQRSAYYPLFRKVLGQIGKFHLQSILEVGCGTGAFAHMLSTRSRVNYRGFDFSEIAVQKAIKRLDRADLFYVADATLPTSYTAEYDGIVCTEVLEHIDKDLQAIENWRSGCTCICSVPNFDSETHVRYFKNEADVVARYAPLLEISGISRIRKPPLSDISLFSYFRAIKWSRYRPRQLMEILGLGGFESTGGWFLFSGKRR